MPCPGILAQRLLSVPMFAVSTNDLDFDNLDLNKDLIAFDNKSWHCLNPLRSSVSNVPDFLDHDKKAHAGHPELDC